MFSAQTSRSSGAGGSQRCAAPGPGVVARGGERSLAVEAFDQAGEEGRTQRDVDFRQQQLRAHRRRQARAPGRDARGFRQQLHQPQRAGARAGIRAVQALLPDDRVDQVLRQSAAPAGGRHLGVEGARVQQVVVVEDLLPGRGGDGLVVPAPAGRESHGLCLPCWCKFIKRGAPLVRGGRRHVAGEQLARAHERRLRRERVDVTLAERERLQLRHVLAIESRGGVDRVPVVRRQHGLVRLAGLAGVAELFAGPCRPVAPARLRAQGLGHRGDGRRCFAPVAGPQRGAGAPFVAAFVEVILVHLAEELERARVTAPGQRQAHRERVRARGACVERARLAQGGKRRRGRFGIGPRKPQPAVLQRLRFDRTRRLRDQCVDFTCRLLDQRGPLQQWRGTFGGQRACQVTAEAGIAGGEREPRTLLGQFRAGAAAFPPPRECRIAGIRQAVRCEPGLRQRIHQACGRPAQRARRQPMTAQRRLRVPLGVELLQVGVPLLACRQARQPARTQRACHRQVALPRQERSDLGIERCNTGWIGRRRSTRQFEPPRESLRLQVRVKRIALQRLGVGGLGHAGAGLCGRHGGNEGCPDLGLRRFVASAGGGAGPRQAEQQGDCQAAGKWHVVRSVAMTQVTALQQEIG